MEGLDTCETPRETSEWTKIAKVGVIFGENVAFGGVYSRDFWHEWA